MNEIRPTQQEHGNPAVFILNDDLIVRYIPKELSRICWHYIARDGEITCKITGQRERSALLRGILIYPVYTLSMHITVQRCLSTSEIVVQVRGLTTLFAEAVIFCFQDFDGNDEVVSFPDLIIISVHRSIRKTMLIFAKLECPFSLLE